MAFGTNEFGNPCRVAPKSMAYFPG